MASTSGKITSAREPILVRLAGDVTVECVVDTGFTGAMMLPREIIERSGVPIIGKEIFQLVSGRSIVASLALIEIDWLGKQQLVRAVISEGSDALIGAELLDGSRLLVDYIADQVTRQRIEYGSIDVRILFK
jgi:clan AA aspartic protease